MFRSLIVPSATKFRRALLSAALASSIGLSACAADGTLTSEGRQFLGGVLGAVTGYAACRASSANDTECAALIIAGATAGVLIARALDPRDRAPRNQAIAGFLDSNSGYSSWNNPETTNSGTLQLLGTTTDEQGRECRQIQENYNQRTGPNPTTTPETYTMCRNGDGQWDTV